MFKKILLILLAAWIVTVLGHFLFRDTSQPAETPVRAGETAGQSYSSKQIDSEKTPKLWEASVNNSKMDGTRTIVLSRGSQDTYDPWIGPNRDVDLEIQCRPKRRIDVLFDFGKGGNLSVENGDETHRGRIKLDELKPQPIGMREGLTSNILFVNSASVLLPALQKHSELIFEFDPFNVSGSRNVTFDITGLRETLLKYPECNAASGAKRN